MLLLAGLCAGVAAQEPVVPCALLSKGQAELRTADDVLVRLHDPQHPNCVGLQLKRGQVVACMRTATGGHCRSMGLTDKFDTKTLNTPPGAPGPMATLWAMLTDSDRPLYAISRSADALPPLPTGAVLLWQPTLQLDFAAHPALRGASSLELREGGSDGALVATLTPDMPSLATAGLKPGQGYWWRVRSDQPGLPVLGRFSLLPAELRAAGLAERQRIVQAAPDDPAAQAVLWAGWLHGQRARHEAAQVLQAAGIGVP